MPVWVTSISLRRSSASATTPLTSENTMIGSTLTRPTPPSASPRSSGRTISETCQRIAADCIMVPAIEISWLVHSRRKLRCWSAGRENAPGMRRESCHRRPGAPNRLQLRAPPADNSRDIRRWEAGSRHMTRKSTPVSSLRLRLFLLVLLGVLPALGVMFYTGLEQRRLASGRVQAEALLLTRLYSD